MLKFVNKKLRVYILYISTFYVTYRIVSWKTNIFESFVPFGGDIPGIGRKNKLGRLALFLKRSSKEPGV